MLRRPKAEVATHQKEGEVKQMQDSYWTKVLSGRISRRRALAGTAGVTGAAAFLAACGRDDDGGGGDGTGGTGSGESSLVTKLEKSTGKPGGVIGVSIGAIGTAAAQQHLRNIPAYLDTPTLGQPEAFIQAKEGLFESDGSIAVASKQFLQQ